MFTAFLDWLDPDVEKAAEEYERARFRLITFFANRNCRFPEELADETINRVIQKIGTEVIEHKLAYIYGVAKFVLLESLRKGKDHLNVEDVMIAAPTPREDTEPLSNKCLDECLERLPGDNRALILEYYSEDKQAKIDLHKLLAEKFAVSQTALRMKVVRIKQKLRGCLQECMA